MAKGFKHGGGAAAAPLNFKVVGGTSRPSAPGENTIWVNTATEISSWVLSPAEPEAAGKTLELLDSLLSECNLWVIQCNISEEAAITAHNAIIGDT